MGGPRHTQLRLTDELTVANPGGTLRVSVVGKRARSVRYVADSAALDIDGLDEPLSVPVHPELGDWVAARCNDDLTGDLEFPESDSSLPGRIDPFSASDTKWLRVAIWGTWLASSASNVISILHSGYRNDFSALYIAFDLAFRGGLMSLVTAVGLWFILRGLFAPSRFDAVRHLTSRLKHAWVASMLAVLAAVAVFLNFKPPTSTIDLVWNNSWFVLFGWIALAGIVVSAIGRRRERELREVERQVVLDFATDDAATAAHPVEVAEPEEQSNW